MLGEKQVSLLKDSSDVQRYTVTHREMAQHKWNFSNLSDFEDLHFAEHCCNFADEGPDLNIRFRDLPEIIQRVLSEAEMRASSSNF